MSFSASWLALRESHDHAARAASLTDSLRTFLQPRMAAKTLRILDLACGSGSTFRYLAPRIGGAQHWVMVDNDEALLALLPGLPLRGGRAQGNVPGGVSDSVSLAPGVTPTVAPSIAAVRLDLAKDLVRLPLRGVDLVTASALLDLVSGDWIDSLVAAISVDRPALLLALSYDGSMRWQPALADDSWVEALFNRHQVTDKGFGPALGPAAAGAATRRLRAAGFTVSQAASPWRLGHGDRAMQRELAGAMAAALAVHFTDDAVRLRRWLDERLGLIDAATSALEVGHTDLLALPAASSGG